MFARMHSHPESPTLRVMAPLLEWQRGPISGCLILCVDGALWPRVEVSRESAATFLVTLFATPQGQDSTVGRFSLLAEAQAAGEHALAREVTEQATVSA